LVSPLLAPLPTRSSRGEDGELDATLKPWPIHEAVVPLKKYTQKFIDKGGVFAHDAEHKLKKGFRGRFTRTEFRVC